MYHFSVVSSICSMSCDRRAISASRRAIFSSALLELNFSMRAIFISHRRIRSSSVISRKNEGLNGSSSSSTRRMARSMSAACSISRSLYMRCSMNIFSSEAKSWLSRASASAISSSRRNMSRVRVTESRSSSVTERNSGLLSRITQQLGEIDTSQSVKAYRASMALSELEPGMRCTTMRASFEVLSSTLRTLIFPFSIAERIEAMSVEVVLPNGSSVITSVLLSIFSILARTLTEPPRAPSLYFDASIRPPVWKSGSSLNGRSCRQSMAASIISLKLWGRIFDERPTAIPSTPWARRRGNFMGRVTGSLSRPS